MVASFAVKVILFVVVKWMRIKRVIIAAIVFKKVMSGLWSIK